MVTIINPDRRLALRRLKSALAHCTRELPRRGNLTVRLTDNAEIRRFNRRYRKIDRATDVLAFPCLQRLPGGFYLGDIMISLPRAAAQARERGHPLERELFLLMLHGLLHLQGYDHETDRGEMLELQESLLSRHGREFK